MRPFKTENSNHVFRAPVGQKAKFEDLDCEVASDPNVVYSVWVPTDKERLELATGWNVKLAIGWIGAFPPVSMQVTDERVLAE